MRPSEHAIRGIGMTSERTRQRLVARLRDKGVQDPVVLDVMLRTPRHLFVDEALASRAYEDTSLPIGHGQTISQPYVVARMTELLRNGQPLERVLEIGTGCGYQTCVLAQLAERVYTLERIEALTSQARRRFRALRLTNVRAKHSDGFGGWPEHGPYQGIIVTAAPPEPPADLLAQLEPGGRMVLPVGDRGVQRLVVIRATGQGYEREYTEAVSFVPMVGGCI